MKLYFSKGACSLAVRITMNELGLTPEYIAVDLKTKTTSSGDDYLKINPKGAVPVIVTDNNEILTENTAIQQYLADLQHAKQLLPAIGDFNRYRVIEWLGYVNSDVHKSFGALFNPTVPNELKEELFIPLLKTKFNFLEKHLEKNEYLTGKNFTLPDAYLFVTIRWLTAFNIDVATWPHVAKYFATLKNRKSVQQALSDEGLQ